MHTPLVAGLYGRVAGYFRLSISGRYFAREASTSAVLVRDQYFRAVLATAPCRAVTSAAVGAQVEVVAVLPYGGK
jgi:hypothetical protein